MYVVLRVTGNQPPLSCIGVRIYCHEVSLMAEGRRTVLSVTEPQENNAEKMPKSVEKSHSLKNEVTNAA